ncbi:hypothetical protein C8R44DRAFT_697030 [Mycena epipterygia]|nr:hypothetical protein C8R44DRAFT_697030 [Mycena epipterygia]
MLLCRRILFQLEFGTFRRFASPHLAIHASTRSIASALHSNDPNPRVSSHGAASNSSLATPDLFQRLSALSNPSLDNEKGPHKMRDKISDLQAYQHIRTLDRPLLAALPLPSYLYLLKQASRLELVGLIGQLIEDILDLGPESRRAVASLAIMSSSALPLIPASTIRTMLEYLHRSPNELDQLSPHTVAVLVRTFADAPPDPADMSLVEVIFPLLLIRLQNLPQPKGHAVLAYTPPGIVPASFAFVDRLLDLSQQQRALDIFQILVNSGNIPSEAVLTMPELTDFASIVRSSLVRASIHWHWRQLAERFLSPLLNKSPSPGRLTITLTVDIIYACLDTPTPADLRACRSLISQVHLFSTVPDGIVRQFYDVAEEIGARQEAHAFYSFSRSEEALKTHRYPPPRGSSLAWLLRYLLDENSHHAQELGEEVLEKHLPIPAESRGHIVGGLASRGHGVLARALWNRFAVGKERDRFVREPALMIRMVSLFNHLVKREDGIIEDRVRRGPLADDELVRQRSKDYKGFLHFVLSEFIKAHSPMSEANHQILTSLARAFFIIGEYIQGFDTLKMLLNRREMPDLHDVNVSLTVMAEHDPRMAAQMVERMIQKGLQPDHITYGTLIHNALNHGDMELVADMVGRVRGLKNPQLSNKSVVALVRGSLAFEPDFAQRSKLQSVYNIIKAIGRSTVVASPHMGRYLVFAALRTGDPAMAYKFWELLSKDNAAWHNRVQVFQRRLIIHRIKEHHKRKWIKEDHARVMLAQLRSQD